jgi:hypothetical protein
MGGDYEKAAFAGFSAERFSGEQSGIRAAMAIIRPLRLPSIQVARLKKTHSS